MKKLIRFLVTTYQFWLWVKLYWLIKRQMKKQRKEVHQLEELWHR